jgi:para-nitrobenzyl esterase
MSIRTVLLAALATATAMILAACSGSNDDAPKPVSEAAITTTSGTYAGVPSTTPSVTAFRGVRYAAPPVGNLRWMPPQPPASTGSSAAPATAKNFAPDCIQLSTPSANQSEDCLFLNVYVPPNAKVNDHLPVMFWIHGGGFTGNSGAKYDPSTLVAENNVIAVTINYRLGAFGYLDHSGLAATSANDFQNVGDASNYGLMDQITALRWVQKNIASFGGDPAQVTVYGESAGAMSIEAMMANPSMSTGLFRAAIMQSGALAYDTFPALGTQRALFQTKFDAAIGCPSPATADCLRSKTTDQVVAATQAGPSGYNSYPESGTKVLPVSVKSAFQSGNYLKIPVLAGTAHDEGRFFVARLVSVPVADAAKSAALGGPVDYYLSVPSQACASNSAAATCSYPKAIETFLNNWNSMFVAIAPASVSLAGIGQQLASVYPMSNFPNRYVGNAPNASLALSKIYTDNNFACHEVELRRDLAMRTPVYGYEFDDQEQPTVNGTAIQPPNDYLGFSSASGHTQDINYLFDVAGYNSSLNSTQLELGRVMRRYWSNFARNLDPNASTGAPSAGATPTFQAYPSVQRLTPGAVAPFSTFAQDHHCTDFWFPLWSKGGWEG